MIIRSDTPTDKPRKARRTGSSRLSSPERDSRAKEPKQARAHESRERLLDGLMRLLQERSYSEISVADIAAAANLTTGAVYGRFGDKHGVAVALGERFLEQSFEMMDEWSGQERWATAGPREIIDGWTRGAVNFHREYRALLTLMLSDPVLRPQHSALTARSSHTLAGLLRDAMGGQVDENFVGDVDFAVRAILERLELSDDDESSARLSRLIARITGAGEDV
ncbi:MAG: TetR/AcrR family transcriptional regulator [Solirubrobacterales bacterium]